MEFLFRADIKWLIPKFLRLGIISISDDHCVITEMICVEQVDWILFRVHSVFSLYSISGMMSIPFWFRMIYLAALHSFIYGCNWLDIHSIAITPLNNSADIMHLIMYWPSSSGTFTLHQQQIWNDDLFMILYVIRQVVLESGPWSRQRYKVLMSVDGMCLSFVSFFTCIPWEGTPSSVIGCSVP